MERSRCVWVSAVLLLCLGCASLQSAFGGGVDLEAKGLSAETPSNVSVYLVAQADDEPLGNLDETVFRIYEDGRLLDATESRPALLDRTLVAEYRTLLLLDMSGALNQGVELDALARAATAFVAKVTEFEPVTVYGFAGAAQPVLIGEYARVQPGAPNDVESKLKALVVQDASRDLGSALVEGTRELDTRLTQSQKPFAIGTLVVFAKGPDLARRVSDQSLWDALSRSPHQSVVIGAAEAEVIKKWGRNGLFAVKPGEDPGPAFQQAASRVIELERSHYLLSYCSPARAGRRVLRVEVVTRAPDGSLIKGGVQQEFDAAAFGPGCDPKRPPRFMPGPNPVAPPPTSPAETAPAPQAPATAPATPAPSTPAPSTPAPSTPAPSTPAPSAPAPATPPSST